MSTARDARHDPDVIDDPMLDDDAPPELSGAELRRLLRELAGRLYPQRGTTDAEARANAAARGGEYPF